MINEAILCLSVAIFREGRGESLVGQYSIAEVIHNRTKHSKYPDNYCDVIKQKSQFSFYKGSASLKPPKYELEAWEESKKVAKNFYKNKTNYTNGSTYFNHKSLGVKYKTNVKPVKYGNHIFY